jgi:hypothetical protein
MNMSLIWIVVENLRHLILVIAVAISHFLKFQGIAVTPKSVIDEYVADLDSRRKPDKSTNFTGIFSITLPNISLIVLSEP